MLNNYEIAINFHHWSSKVKKTSQAFSYLLTTSQFNTKKKSICNNNEFLGVLQEQQYLFKYTKMYVSEISSEIHKTTLKKKT